jgi:hypothetical protein
MLSAFALVIALNSPAVNDQHGHSGSAHPSSASHATTPHETQASSGHVSGDHHASGDHKTTTTTHKTTTKTTTTKTTTGTTTTTTLTPVQQKVSTHTNLANKLQSRLPVGTDVVAAAKGFRNLGQFVAAVNVSHNLGIPFSQLKADMVDKHMSLGQSIQDLRPTTTTATATHEAERAETEAKTEIEVETHSTTTTTKTRTPKRTSGHE